MASIDILLDGAKIGVLDLKPTPVPPEHAKESCYIDPDNAAENPDCVVVKATPVATATYVSRVNPDPVSTYNAGIVGSQSMQALPGGIQNIVNHDLTRTQIVLVDSGMGPSNHHVRQGEAAFGLAGAAIVLGVVGAYLIHRFISPNAPDFSAYSKLEKPDPE